MGSQDAKKAEYKAQISFKVVVASQIETLPYSPGKMCPREVDHIGIASEDYDIQGIGCNRSRKRDARSELAKTSVCSKDKRISCLPARIVQKLGGDKVMDSMVLTGYSQSSTAYALKWPLK
jgi:hypothetical protein